MTIDKQIEEALERVVEYPEYEVIGDFYQKREAYSILNAHGKTIAACLQAILEEGDNRSVALCPDCMGSGVSPYYNGGPCRHCHPHKGKVPISAPASIKTRVKELLESSADVKERSFN
jgi:DnaJ-class molecular chaperone